MADYDLSAKMTLDASGYTRNIEKAQKSTKTFTEKLKETIDKVGNNGLTKSLANLSLATAGIKTAFSSATKIFKDVTKAVTDCSNAYRAQYNAEVQLETASQNNPFLNSSSVQQLKAYASEMQRISTMGDEQILPYMAQLASAGRTQEQIQKIVKTALDVSASGAMSFDSAITQLNATFSGNIGLMGRQIGELKNLSAEQLKNGDAIDIVAGKYAGLAEATAKATGSSEQLKNVWGDFKENIGKGFEEKLAPVRTWLTGIISQLNESIAKRDKLAGAHEAQKEGNADLEQYNALLSEQAEKLSDLIADRGAYLELGAWKLDYTDAEEAGKAYDKQIEKERQLLRAYSLRIEYLRAVADYEEKQRIAEQERADAEAQRLAKEAEINKIASEAKATYAETLANYEKELETRKLLGEEISRQDEIEERLNLIKSASLQLIKDGQGYITFENAIWDDILSTVTAFNAEMKGITDEEQKQAEWEAFKADLVEKTNARRKELSEQILKKENDADMARRQQRQDRWNEIAEEAELEKQEAEAVKKQWSNAFSAVGNAIKTAFSTAINFVKNAVKSAFNLFSRLIDFNLDDATDKLLKVEDKILTFFYETLPKIPSFISTVFSSLGNIIGANYQTWTTELLTTAKQLFTDVLTGLKSAVESGKIKEVITFAVDIVGDILDYAIDNLGDIIKIGTEILVSLLEAVLKKLPDIIVSIVENLPEILSSLIELTTRLATTILENLPTILGTIVGQLPNILWEITKAIAEIIAKAFIDLPRALSEGLTNLATSAWQGLKDTASSVGSFFKGLFGFATGVNNAPRGLALVGEQGPELIDFHGGERVYTASNTRQMMGSAGGGNSFNVTFNNVTDTSASAMMRELRRYNRELAINGVI